MKENELLNTKPNISRTPRNWVKELVPQPSRVMEYLEFEIKYVYVAGKRKNVLILTVVDVASRWVLGQYIGWKVNEYDVRILFEKIFNYYDLPKKVYVRNDNGSQFIASTVRNYFKSMDVIQEFTKPATPEQNAHMESYHSLMERAICQRYEFSDLEEVHSIFNRWIKFYNFERIYSGINYQNPAQYLNSKGFNIDWCQELEMVLDSRQESFNSIAI